MAQATQAMPNSLATQDWKNTLKLPPKDPRHRTEVGLAMALQGVPQGVVRLIIWALAQLQIACWVYFQQVCEHAEDLS